MKLIKSLFVGLLSLTAFASYSSAAVILDDFESYASSAQLNSTWNYTGGNVSTLTLTTSGAFDGLQAMGVQYSVASGSQYSQLGINYGVNVDWSNYTAISFYMYNISGSSKENIKLVLKDQYGTSLFTSAAVATTQSSIGAWTQYTVDITSATSRTNVRDLIFAITPTNYGTGNFMIDDITAIPEPNTTMAVLIGIGLLAFCHRQIRARKVNSAC